MEKHLSEDTLTLICRNLLLIEHHKAITTALEKEFRERIQSNTGISIDSGNWTLDLDKGVLTDAAQQ